MSNSIDPPCSLLHGLPHWLRDIAMRIMPNGDNGGVVGGDDNYDYDVVVVMIMKMMVMLRCWW